MPTDTRRIRVRYLCHALAASLVLLAAMSGCGEHRAPSPEQCEQVRAYYSDIFESAEAITIRSPLDTDFHKTVLRSGHPDAFSRIEAAVAEGEVHPDPCECVISWQLDVRRTDGSEVREISVCDYLLSADQPLAGELWLYPVRAKGRPPSYGIVEEIDSLAGRTCTGDPLPDASQPGA